MNPLAQLHRRRGTLLLDNQLLEAAAEELGEATRAADDEAEVSRDQNLLTLVRLGQGRHEESLAAAEAAVAAAKRVPGELAIVSRLNRLVALAEVGRLGEAHAEAAQLELELRRGAGAAAHLLPNFYQTAANISYEQGLLGEAKARALSAELLLSDAENPYLLGVTLLTRAVVAIDEGEGADGLALLARAQQLMSREATPAVLAHVESERARAHLLLGQNREALYAAILAADLLLRDPAFLDYLELGRVVYVLSLLLVPLQEPNLAASLAEKADAWVRGRGRRLAPLPPPRKDGLSGLPDETLRRLFRVLDYLEALLRGDDDLGRRLAQRAYHSAPELSQALDRTLLEHAAYRSVRQDTPAPPLPPAVLDALLRVEARLRGDAAIASPEADALDVLAPYTRATLADASYVDTLNQLLRRTTVDLSPSFVDGLVRQHLLPEERGLTE